MFAHSLSNRFSYFGHQPRVLERSNGRIICSRDLFELVMSVKINFPTKFRELVGETGVYEVYGTFVYAYFGLRDWVGFMQTCEGFRDTYLTTTSIFHTEMS